MTPMTVPTPRRVINRVSQFMNVRRTRIQRRAQDVVELGPPPKVPRPDHVFCNLISARLCLSFKGTGHLRKMKPTRNHDEKLIPVAGGMYVGPLRRTVTLRYLTFDFGQRRTHHHTGMGRTAPMARAYNSGWYVAPFPNCRFGPINPLKWRG